MPIIDRPSKQNKAERAAQVANAIQEYGETIDGEERQLEDEGMSEATFTAPRRSTRVFRRLPVKASGKDHNGRKFREACETVVVNAHGGLLLLKHEIDNGVMIVIENPITQEEQECRVVYLGEPSDRGQRVGVEFLTPSPHFWGVEFEDGTSTRVETTH
jgi:hypothetical protein